MSVDGAMTGGHRRVRLIAYYLPQYHPIPENDEWWGKGFTEWTNVAKARPLFRGHYQPRIPADLGFYDLRVPETRAAQAEMAATYGIEGFCYWHYWFAGRRILERPFTEVLKSGEPRFPFCLAWANQTWTGVWHGSPDRILIEQTYPGLKDYEDHFYVLLEAFRDDRYMTVDSKPIFVVYCPKKLPEPKRVTDLWRELAHRAGLKGLHLVGQLFSPGGESWAPQDHGFDAAVVTNLPSLFTWVSWRQPIQRARLTYKRVRGLPTIYRCKDVLPSLVCEKVPGIEAYPSLIPNWDNTPRCGTDGLVLHDSTPELFQIHVRHALEQVAAEPFQHRIIFVKSWNEWAEGNYLEPDIRFGRKYLEVLRKQSRTSVHDGNTIAQAMGGLRPSKLGTAIK